MVAEITILVGAEDLITAETDAEMEHEESKEKEEKEKEKTSKESDLILVAEDSMISRISLTTYQDPSWNTPFIDFQTPPPKLS